MNQLSNFLTETQIRAELRLTKIIPGTKVATQTASMFSPEAAFVYFADERRAAKLAKLVRANSALTYEQLDETPQVKGTTLNRKADLLIENGWSRDGVRDVKYEPPWPWDANGRSFSFHMHAWEHLTVLLAAHSANGRLDCLRIAERSADEWLERYQKPLLSADDITDSLDQAQSDTERMAWYDMAVGQRLQRMSYLADVLIRDETTDNGKVQLLFQSIVFHHELLSRDSFFVSHNNHGFYQAIGQLASAHRFRMIPGFDRYISKATNRLAEMLEKSFFATGPHKEHSPTYHSMVLGSALGARDAGLVSDPQVLDRLAKAEKALGWMIQPDNTLVPFGDSTPKPRLYLEDQLVLFQDHGLKQLLRGDQFSSAVPQGLVSYEDAGYVFARRAVSVTGEAELTNAYFAQSAGFHSRVHKHADHLNFVWYDRGASIFTDPARYGYVGKTQLGDELSEQGFYYSDPKRIYVERTRAHNCVEIDSQDHPRKKTKPFGSALRHATEYDGLWATLSEVRFPGQIRHFRVLCCRPSHFIVAIDWLQDGNGTEHDFRQWFQLAPGWEAYRQGGQIVAKHAKLDLSLCGLALADGVAAEPVSGQTEPELQGWISDDHLSLVPATSLHWEALATPKAKFMTLFSLSKSVKPLSSSVSDGFTTMTAVWVDERGRNDLRVERKSATNELSVSFKNLPERSTGM
jgi:hypothetical protein